MQSLTQVNKSRDKGDILKKIVGLCQQQSESLSD